MKTVYKKESETWEEWDCRGIKYDLPINGLMLSFQNKKIVSANAKIETVDGNMDVQIDRDALFAHHGHPLLGQLVCLVLESESVA